MPGRDFSAHMRRPVKRRYDKTSGFGLSAIIAFALAGGWAGPGLAQTMDSALARAYSGNPTLRWMASLAVSEAVE